MMLAMKVPGFDDIFFYRNMLGANCVVYAFLRDDGAIDLLDTGIYYIRPVLSKVLVRMQDDDINFHRVKNIYHTHGHFDHCQADRYIINHSMFDVVKVHCPAADMWRLLPGNDARQTAYFVEHAARYLPGNFDELFAKSGFGSVRLQFRLFVSKFMRVPPLEKACLVPLHDGDTVHIGRYKGRVITTGGHSDGHSFFHVADNDMLVIGDHDAVNEITCDYRKIIKASAIIRDLDPNVALVGHQGIPSTRAIVRQRSAIWFIKFQREVDLFLKAAERFDNKLSMTYFLNKILGYSGKIVWLRYWAFQNLFVIAKFAQEEGLGNIVYDPETRDLCLELNRAALREFRDDFEGAVTRIKNG
nr:MBL fold metallo-hydrolase [Candidatus Sigynarchaeota archaeon]